jgi:hypothetical protein
MNDGAVLFFLIWSILILKGIRFTLGVRYRHPNNQIKHRRKK